MGTRRSGRCLCRALRGVAGLVALLPFLGGCGDPEPLRALQAEPLATQEFRGLELVDEITQDAESVTVTGKPVYARVTRIFRFTGEGTPEELVDLIAEQASEDGWSGDRFKDTGFVWFKKIDGRQGDLNVTVAPHNGEDHLYLYLRIQ